MKNETKHICPFCGTEMSLYDYRGYHRDSKNYDLPPEFIVTWEQYKCPECGELKNVDLISNFIKDKNDEI